MENLKKYIEKQQSIMRFCVSLVHVFLHNNHWLPTFLLDEGIINQEEFDFKKKELLGL
ncbi:hypothetical protein EfmGK941_20360 [Enterococcus faecium]|nr:hypothetical protein EfmGK941_20360 [Enterococcus faecium]